MQAARIMPIQSHRIDRTNVGGPGLVGLVGLLSVMASCAVPIKMTELNPEIPRTAMPVAVAAGIDAMEDPQTERRIQHLMATPEMRAIEQELVAGVVDGTLSALSEKERAARIGALTTRAMTGILRGAARELGPGISEMTSGAMNGALDAALSTDRRHALEGLVEGIVASGIRSAAAGLHEAEIGKNLARAITEQLGPALRQTLRQDLAPALAEVLRNEELNRALGATARMVAHETVMGATEALVHAQPSREEGSILSRASDLAHQGARLFGTAAWVLVLVIAVLLAWTFQLLSQARLLREESARRATTSRLVVEATKAAEGKPWADELIGVLREHIRAEEQAIAELQRAKRRPSRHGNQESGKSAG